LDKRVFLDHLPDQNLDEEVQSRAETIWKVVTLERANMPGIAKAGAATPKAAVGSQARTVSIFGKIASAIFGHHPATAAPTTANVGAAPAGTQATGQPMTRAQVEDMLKKIADQQHEDLDWRRSIVELMKLLKLDSSLNARKELAQELGYKGALIGSAEMNVWLHEQVMQKLAESGGVVPESLKHA
jgi:hypothetical protein